MDESMMWSRLQILGSSLFCAINMLLLIQWRASLSTMLRIVIGGFLSLAILSFTLYSYFHLSLILFFQIFVFLLFLMAWALSEYRDERTLFCVLSALALSLSASNLATAWAHCVGPAWVKVAVGIPVNVLLTVSIHLWMQQTCKAAMRLGRKGWALGCLVPLLPFVAQTLISAIPEPLNVSTVMVPAAVVLSFMIWGMYLMLANFVGRMLKQLQSQREIQTLQMQVSGMASQIKELAAREQADAVFRHDLRHYGHLIEACIRTDRYEEALDAVSGMLGHPSVREPLRRFCINPTINALIAYFAGKAAEEGVELTANVDLDTLPGIDVMELAVFLANTIENACTAAARVPKEQQPMVHVKIHTAGEQLFIKIRNSCAQRVRLDAKTGLPEPDPKKKGHGIGVVSIQAFMKKYCAQVDCAQQDGFFEFRAVV